MREEDWMCVLIIILFGRGMGEQVSGPPESEKGGVSRVNAFEGLFGVVQLPLVISVLCFFGM